MDNLESLSDEELRLRLLQYGFPNLPVTSTTRKILIKKLRLQINKERGKVRNDTSIATSFSSEEESDSPDSSRISIKSRRTTITPKSNYSTSSATKKDRDFAMPVTPSPTSYGRTSTRPTRYSSQNIHVSPLIQGDSDDEPDSFNGFSPKSVTANSTIDESTRTNGFDSPSIADLRKRFMMIRNETINNNRKTMNGPCGTFSSSTWTPSTSTYTTRTTMPARSIENDIVCHAEPVPEQPVKPFTVAIANLVNKLDEYYGVKQTFVPCSLLSILILFFVIIGGMYMTISPDIKSALVIDSTKYIFCEDLPSSIATQDCIERAALEPTLDFISKIITELQDRAILQKCVDSDHPFVMSPRDIITYVLEMDASSHVISIMKHLHNAQYLIGLNPQWKLRNVDLTGRPITMEQTIFGRDMETSCLAMPEPVLPMSCILRNKFQKFFVIVGLLALISAIVYLIRLTYVYFKMRAQARKDQVNAIISDITSAVIKQGMRAKTDPNEDPCIVVAHLRDNVIPVTKRREFEWAWIEAMKFLEANESRISFEVGNRNGEDCKLMRWIDPSTITPHSSPNTSIANNSTESPFARPSTVSSVKSWQGPAFDKQNKIKDPPTPCLKIRQMFDKYDANDPTLKQVIQDAILAKVGNTCRIYDVQLDTASCCVYVRCASEQDAGMVHDEINGWWFDNRLVSIKFLRLERYLTRFPAAAQAACVSLRPTSLASIQNLASNNNKGGSHVTTNGDDDDSSDQ
ncbi:inner nuclear membrane protein Man1 [Culicoides brevitarsis]|uniref:inner nuclear membrane protein Man1 n=1 Tax=Culicoides brevitarsis TaxID=469753 RepID=UPI00307BBAD3